MFKERKDLESKSWYRLLLALRYLVFFLSLIISITAFWAVLEKEEVNKLALNFGFIAPIVLLMIWGALEIALIFVLGANPNPNNPLSDKRFIIGGFCVIAIVLFSALIAIGLHDTPLAPSEMHLNFTHIKTGNLQRVHLDLADKYYASDNYRISDGQMFYLALDGRILESGPFKYKIMTSNLKIISQLLSGL